MKLKEINLFINQLDVKANEIERKKESIIIDFVNNFDLKNIKQIEIYTNADMLLDKALCFVKKRRFELTSILERQNAKIN